MKKKTVLVSAVILLTVGAILLVVKNLDYLVNKYQWHKADIAAETRHDETLKKFKAGQILSSTEVNQLIAYYSLTSKEDEGINLLQEILLRSLGSDLEIDILTSFPFSDILGSWQENPG